MAFTRRDFGRFTLASLPVAGAVSIPTFALAAPNSKIKGVQIGAISYSYRQGVPKPEIAPDMAKIGLSEVELMSGDLETLAGAPAVGGGGGGRGRGQGGPGGPGPMAAGTTPRPAGGDAVVAGAPGAPPPPGGPGGPGRGRGGGRTPMTPEQQAAMQERQKALKDWRDKATPETFKAGAKTFHDAGVKIEILCYNMGVNVTDDEIDYAFRMAKALGVKAISSSSTVAVAKRVAPFADKHKLMWAGHGHDNVNDPEQFAKPETFELIMSYSKYIGTNLDIGHFTAANYDPIAFIKQHYDRITNIHLKDRKKDHGPNVPWGQGDTPIKEVLQLMSKEKYTFPANIEFEYAIPEGSDAPTEVAKCYEYAKKCLEA